MQRTSTSRLSTSTGRRRCVNISVRKKYSAVINRDSDNMNIKNFFI
ncbi:MAG: hypothetical protein ACO1OO_01855 [Flavisolibacter sp.]